ncbi:MAG: selenium-dependent xanthine dehydrogenase [Phycisphaeraceae bacterium]|nr:MAG: selenium-dependent xanthine dehydrogenase [Phycisphaeraceae bacterium]
MTATPTRDTSTSIRLTVNGVERTFSGDPDSSLLDFIREGCGDVSPKDGCSPQAACGACAVELDGKVVLSCVIPMKKAEGGAVITPAGLDPKVGRALTDAFAECGGAQCSYCIPGIAVRAANLIQSNPDPTDDEIRVSLNQHLCRCTGYQKIVDSIRVAAESLRSGRPVEKRARGAGVGERLAKHNIRPAILGARLFVADMTVDNMLHGAVRLSDHPRARVLKIDTAEAEALPGVRRVFLAADIPGKRHVGLILADWPVLVAEGETTRYVGDVIACVAAETRAVAREAAQLIHVEYEVLEPVTDIFEAIRPDAPPIHEGGNVLSVSRAKKGDTDAAFAACARVVEQTYTTQFIEHAYLEPEACIACPTDRGVKIYSQSQGVYEDRRQLASLLSLEEKDVDVVLVPNGGGFGGKEDMCVQGHAALMARLLGQPVKVVISRDESILMHPKRHPLHMVYKVGCSAQGELLAVKARIHGDTGAYASVGMKVLERAAGHATGAYHVPNVDVESTAVTTNNIPCGAMRGFGANQANFAIESIIDELCEAGGFDRWQFRYDNALTEGRSTATGQVLASGVGVRATLEAVKEQFQSAKHAGIACGLKNTGIGNGMPDAGTARILVKSADHVELHHGWTEMGQGVDTMTVQTFCQETHLPPEIVSVHVDTAYDAPCGMTTASRATSLVGNAIIDACAKLNADLAKDRLANLAGREYYGEWVCDWTNKPGNGDGKPIKTHYSYSYATQVVILDDAGKVERVIAAHDAGRVMNPTLFEGQIEGSVHMGLGYALTEELAMEGGRPKSTRLRKCGVMRAKDMPEIDVIGVEVPDEFGPYGAKGVGEIGLVPTAPAVANALYTFDGRRRRSLPMKD